jgi:hypothetical protein
MKNILFLAHQDPGQEARLQGALDVARALDGHLICMDMHAKPVPMVDAFSRAGLRMAAEDLQQREACNRAAISERLDGEGVPFEWIDGDGDVAASIRLNARLMDLIVLNTQLAAPGFQMERITADVLVETGKPVLAMPEHHHFMKLYGAHAMIAWDGSDQAIRALSAAVPLLRIAQRATIIAVGDDSNLSSAEDAATYISRHGVKPSILPVAGDDDYIPHILLDRAWKLRTDYIVMGGFSHWRLIERNCLGTSHWLLKATHTPLFMAH